MCFSNFYFNCKIQQNTVSIKAVGEIALFCKFWFVSQPVRSANVCNVRWLPQLSPRAEAGGQKLIFSCTNFQSMSQYFQSDFSNYNLVSMLGFRSFTCSLRFAATRRWRFRSTSLSTKQKL